MTESSKLMTVAELADLLRVPVQTVYSWSHRRCGPPPIKVGRHLRYRLSDVEEWLSDRRT